MKFRITAIALAMMVTIGMIFVPQTNTAEAAEIQSTDVVSASDDITEGTAAERNNAEKEQTAGQKENSNGEQTDRDAAENENDVKDNREPSKEVSGAESVQKTAAARNANKKEDVMAPESVDDIDARAKGRGKTVIEWTAAENADGYYIYSSAKKNSGYKKIMTVNGEDNTKCVHRYKKLRKNKKYFYKVYAFKEVGNNTLISEDTDRDPAKNTLSYKKAYKMKATAYSGGGYCANGKKCKVGRVAVDPRVIPLGTWLYVKGYGFCQACDTGGAIKGKRIDLYFRTEGKCNRYGVKNTKVYVLRK